jgi:hypothetical protein
VSFSPEKALILFFLLVETTSLDFVIGDFGETGGRDLLSGPAFFLGLDELVGLGELALLTTSSYCN